MLFFAAPVESRFTFVYVKIIPFVSVRTRPQAWDRHRAFHDHEGWAPGTKPKYEADKWEYGGISRGQ
jgi:hypothetical protein